MRLLPHLAHRFLLSKSTDGFLAFISWVSVIGVALGVLALIVVTGVINGFEGEIARAVTSVNGDVLLYARGDTVENSDLYPKKIREVLGGHVGISPSFVAELMVAGPKGVAGGLLEGIDPVQVREATQIPRAITQGREPLVDGEYALGEALANRLGVKLHDEIRLIVPITAGDRSDSFVPTSTVGKVVGILKLGMYDYDSKYLFGRIDAVQKLLGSPGRVTTYKIKLLPGMDAGWAAKRLSESFGYPFRAKAWMQLNRNLLYAIQLEKIVISIILASIIVVAAFNVVCALMMMIEDKSKEIAILKSIGFRPGQGFRLFLFIGVAIGLVGVLTGVGLGLGVNEVLKRVNWIKLPPDVYSIGFLPVQNRWHEVMWIAILGLFFTFLSALYPAFKVAYRRPLEGLKDDAF